MEITYKSDFSFVLKPRTASSADTVEIGDNWKLYLWTTTRTSQYVVSRVGDQFCRCVVDGEHIVVTVIDHAMSPGALHGELQVLMRDDYFPSGYRKTVIEIEPDIILTDKEIDNVPMFDIDVYLPVLYMTSYDMAVKEGYTGTADEFYTMLVNMPAHMNNIDDLQGALGELVTASSAIDYTVQSLNATASALDTDALETLVKRLEEQVDRLSSEEDSTDADSEVGKYQDAAREYTNPLTPGMFTEYDTKRIPSTAGNPCPVRNGGPYSYSTLEMTFCGMDIENIYIKAYMGQPFDYDRTRITWNTDKIYARRRFPMFNCVFAENPYVEIAGDMTTHFTARFSVPVYPVEFASVVAGESTFTVVNDEPTPYILFRIPGAVLDRIPFGLRVGPRHGHGTTAYRLTIAIEITDPTYYSEYLNVPPSCTFTPRGAMDVIANVTRPRDITPEHLEALFQ